MEDTVATYDSAEIDEISNDYEYDVGIEEDNRKEGDYSEIIKEDTFNESSIAIDKLNLLSDSDLDIYGPAFIGFALIVALGLISIGTKAIIYVFKSA